MPTCWRSHRLLAGPQRPDLLSAAPCRPSPPDLRRWPIDSWPSSYRLQRAVVRAKNACTWAQAASDPKIESSGGENGSRQTASTQERPGQSGSPLRPIHTHPVPLDAQGLVPSTASLAAVPQHLIPLLGAAVTVYQGQVPEGLLGVYVRGSLVQGGFLPGLSDADFFALFTPGAASESSTSVAAGLQQAAEQLQREFPQCAKVELKLVALPPGSMLSALAQSFLGAASVEGGGPSPAHIPPAALLDQQSLAFMLKTQAVTLHGWDLPSLLPDTAALPPLQLLPDLVQDVGAALQHAEQGACSGTASAARAVRWALKRCIRAAFELRFCCRATAGEEAVYSRDLYWCIRYASQQHPELSQVLEAAGQAYLTLGLAPGAQLQPAQAPGGDPQQAAVATEGGQAALVEGAALAARLAEQIDWLFLEAMLTEEPGWLTYHGGAAQPGAGREHGPGHQLQHQHQPRLIAGTQHAGVGSTSTSSSSSSAGSRGSRLDWWQRLRVGLWVAGAGALGDSLEGDLVGCPPPPLGLPISGDVLTLAWGQPGAQQRAAAIVAAAVGLEAAQVLGIEGVEALPAQPVLLKGAAAHWGAVGERGWSLAGLAAAGLEGRVRVAPSLQFPFTEPRLAAILAAEQGATALPSCAARMSGAEFAARMQRGNPFRLPPLVYSRPSKAWPAGGRDAASSAQAQGQPAEYYYLQAELPDPLLRDIDLSSPPFALPGPSGPVLMQQAQAARVWASPAGAVSPTHYDLSHSFLVQVKGRKRMVFWSPDTLPCLYFYPDTHLLRRRSRVNMHAPDSARFPLLARAAAFEAQLEPGDVVFFPSRWAHYTESLSFSISVTSRYAGKGQD